MVIKGLHILLLNPWVNGSYTLYYNFPVQNTRVSCHSLLQGIFPTKGSNPGLLHCRQSLVYYSPLNFLFLSIKEFSLPLLEGTCVAHHDCWRGSVRRLLYSSDGKESPCNADLGSIPGSRRFPGEGNGNPLQYSCLENLMDREAWWATFHGVTKSRTQLSD